MTISNLPRHFSIQDEITRHHRNVIEFRLCTSRESIERREADDEAPARREFIKYLIYRNIIIDHISSPNGYVLISTVGFLFILAWDIYAYPD